jgi:hypothetical protein
MTVSMQSTNLSSVSPRLVIYNVLNQTQSWQSSLPNSFGATATLSLSVSPGQSFYIRTSAASALGSYGAYALQVNFGSQPQAPVAPPVTVVPAAPDAGGGSSNELTGPAGGNPILQGLFSPTVLLELHHLGLSWAMITQIESAYANVTETVTYGTLTGYGEHLEASPLTAGTPSSHHHQPIQRTHHGHTVTHHLAHSPYGWDPHHS